MRGTRVDLGDGDPCPEPGDHGKLYTTERRHQWCAVTQTIFDWDGKTVLRPGYLPGSKPLILDEAGSMPLAQFVELAAKLPALDITLEF